MPRYRIVLAACALCLLAGAAIAQSEPGGTARTPLPPQRPAAAAVPAAGADAPQQAAVIAPEIKPPPVIGGVEPAAMSKGFNPSALSADQKAALLKVNAYLNGLRVMSGSFTQVNPDGTRSTGQFWISKPGKMRFQYAPPSPVELVADGRSLAVRDRKLRTQDLYFISQTPLRFLLADQVDLISDARVVGVGLPSDWVAVTLEEKSTLAGHGPHPADVLVGGLRAEAMDRDRRPGLRDHGRPVRRRHGLAAERQALHHRRASHAVAGSPARLHRQRDPHQGARDERLAEAGRSPRRQYGSARSATMRSSRSWLEPGRAGPATAALRGHGSALRVASTTRLADRPLSTSPRRRCSSQRVTQRRAGKDRSVDALGQGARQARVERTWLAGEGGVDDLVVAKALASPTTASTSETSIRPAPWA